MGDLSTHLNRWIFMKSIEAKKKELINKEVKRQAPP
jgi:hypothetical protein